MILEKKLAIHKRYVMQKITVIADTKEKLVGTLTKLNNSFKERNIKI